MVLNCSVLPHRKGEKSDGESKSCELQRDVTEAEPGLFSVCCGSMKCSMTPCDSLTVNVFVICKTCFLLNRAMPR